MKKLLFLTALLTTFAVGATTLDRSGVDSPNKNNNNWEAVAEYFYGWINNDTFSQEAKLNAVPYVKHTQLTSAQVEAGYVLLNSVPGKQIWPTGGYLYPDAACTTATAVQLQTTDSAATTSVLSIPIASLANASTVSPLVSSAYTYGAMWVQGLSEGGALEVQATGSTLAGCATIDVVLEYMIQ